VADSTTVAIRICVTVQSKGAYGASEVNWTRHHWT